MNAELVVGTRSWIEHNNGSYKRGVKSPERHHWIRQSEMGAVVGEPSALDPPVLGWQPPGGSRWSPTRRPDGRAYADTNSPKASPRTSSNAASPKALESPKKKKGISLFKAAGRAAQLGAKFSRANEDSDPSSPGVRKIATDFGGSVRSFEYGSPGVGDHPDFGMTASTSLPFLKKEDLAFPSPPSYVRCVDRSVGKPCSHL